MVGYAVNSSVIQWAIRNQVSQQALDELRAIWGSIPVHLPVLHGDKDEAYVQSRVRLEAAQKGMRLWRNNVGALLDSRGVPVRYGLANESPAINRILKSGDLIGWRPVLITAAHVGSRLAQFVSRECKRPGWKYCGDDRERAQLRWVEAVVSDGGDAKFCSGEGTL